MPPEDDNAKVIPFSRARGIADLKRTSQTLRANPDGSLPSPEELRAIERDLEELTDCLERVSPEPGRSPQAWRIDSMPFRMRVPAVRQRLHILDDINPSDWAHGISWVLKLRDRRAKLEQRLTEFAVCLDGLLDDSAVPQDRARSYALFRAQGRELTRALEDVRRLVVETYGNTYSSVSGKQWSR
jgi:hypothetical protein